MEINVYNRLFKDLENSRVSNWIEDLREAIPQKFNISKDGNIPRFREAIESMPHPIELKYSQKNGYVQIGNKDSFATSENELVEKLKKLSPWRKGPWELAGIKIETEWHSDWKWDRVVPHISDVTNRTILDVGSGNGYFCYRMVEAGAKLAIGIDPGMLSVQQFLLMKRYTMNIPAWVLPLGIEEMPNNVTFDTVFSMGVLYHRRSPIDHITRLKSLLRPKGELVLETIIVDEEYGSLLMPEDRYQRMRNVWFIPSVTMLELWLRRCGFKNIKTVSVEKTTIQEQRSTEWMPFDSLEQFLDPSDHTKTIEGYPAPKRAVVIATAP